MATSSACKSWIGRVCITGRVVMAFCLLINLIFFFWLEKYQFWDFFIIFTIFFKLCPPPSSDALWDTFFTQTCVGWMVPTPGHPEWFTRINSNSFPVQPQHRRQCQDEIYCAGPGPASVEGFLVPDSPAKGVGNLITFPVWTRSRMSVEQFLWALE